MRRFTTAIVALVALLMLAVAPAQAYDTDYYNQSRRMLQSAPIFVSGVVTQYSEADIETAQQVLDGTNAALVALPAAAASGDDDIRELAVRLSQDSRYPTVGLLVGDSFTAASRTQTAELLPDVVNRTPDTTLTALAASIIDVTTLQVDAGNTPEAPLESASHISWIFAGIVVVAVACVAAWLVIRWRKASNLKTQIHQLFVEIADKDGVVLLKRDACSNRISEMSSEIAKLIHDLLDHLYQQIENSTYQEGGEQGRRAKSEDKRSLRDIQLTYIRHLKSIRQMLDTYLDWRENPRYYNRPIDVEVTEALEAFKGEALKHIRMVKNREGLRSFYTAVAELQLYTPPDRTLS